MQATTSVDDLRARSSSMNQSHSAAASAKVAPVRTIPGSAPRRAWSSTSRSQASAVRLVNQPTAGRPRSPHAGPIFSGHIRTPNVSAETS
jgi:hypothetical protein